jgi:hypothetical protein
MRRVTRKKSVPPKHVAEPIDLIMDDEDEDYTPSDPEADDRRSVATKVVAGARLSANVRPRVWQPESPVKRKRPHQRSGLQSPKRIQYNEVNEGEAFTVRSTTP